MPLSIIRNDITKVSADAIVNTANPHAAIGAGTDQAIYSAAGMKQLLAEREKIGDIRPGSAAYTPAFALDAKYIIHTVGPAWRGGGYQERETVASCYKNSLAMAAELGCESVAFPLISTGTYGFPKDEALRIAVDEISSFLFDHDMTVYLVVYDKESFVITGRAFAGVKSYIAEHEVKRSNFVSRYNKSRRCAENDAGAAELNYSLGAPVSAILESRDACYGAALAEPEEAEAGFDTDEAVLNAAEALFDADEAVLNVAEALFDADEALASAVQEPPSYRKLTIDDIIGMKEDTFQQVLFRIIDRKGMTDPEVYKRSNLDRKLFSKIRSDIDYSPSKKTVLALIIGLELNVDEATDLLNRAGYSFSPADLSDLTVRACIEQHMYNIHMINCYLFDLGQKTLGA